MSTKPKWRLGDGYADPEMPDRVNGEYSGPKYADLGVYKDGVCVLPIRIDHHQIIIDEANGMDVRTLEAVLGELIEIANRPAPTAP